MERLLHYVWKNRLIPHSGMRTTVGENVEVLSPGLHNKDAGPDFFCADVIIGGVDWMGNVEIHTRSSDWYRHGHDKDKAYNNVVLHVVEEADTEVVTQSGRTLPQMVVSVPDYVVRNYEQLQAYDEYPPCHGYIAKLPSLVSRQWMSRLGQERMERKAAEIEQRLLYCEHNWEQVFFVTLARAFGFGLNGDAFEQWARLIPFGGAAKHRDNRLQIAALFFGQAGFLDETGKFDERLSNALPDLDLKSLRSEYKFLANKFSLTPMGGHEWRFLRTRPQNFPTIRLAQIACLYCEGKANLSCALEAATIDEARHIFDSIQMPQKSVDLLILNGMIPMLYAYGHYRGNRKMQDKAQRWLAQLPPESNKHTRPFAQMGLMDSAADSQAVIQLVTRYCQRHDCLRCQFGYQYIKKHKK